MKKQKTNYDYLLAKPKIKKSSSGRSKSFQKELIDKQLRGELCRAHKSS